MFNVHTMFVQDSAGMVYHRPTLIPLPIEVVTRPVQPCSQGWVRVVTILTLYVYETVSRLVVSMHKPVTRYIVCRHADMRISNIVQ